MHRLSEELIQNAVDLNETIVFEFHIQRDEINFSDNLTKYIPLPLTVHAFTATLSSHEKVHPDDVKSAVAFFSSLKSAEKIRMEYVRFLDFGGTYRWYQLKGSAESNASGVPEVIYGTLTYIDDETKRRNEEDALERDELTGLLKEKSLYEQLAAYIEKTPKGVFPNLMVIAIDEFDEWIRTHGNAGADGAILEIAKLFSRAFRGSDLIGRLKTDQFAVSMKGVRSMSVLLERASYVRTVIREVFQDRMGVGDLTVSIGISAFDRKKATPQKLLDRALAALADARQSGRDTYILYDADFKRYDQSENPTLSTKEMELVRDLLDPIPTSAYAVDDQYRLLYGNTVFLERFGAADGGFCYVGIKGEKEPCSDCPVKRINESTGMVDCKVYCPVLQNDVLTRARMVTLRNGKPIYIILSVREREDAIY